MKSFPTLLEEAGKKSLLGILNGRIRNCRVCDIAPQKGECQIIGEGQENPKIIVCAESPGFTEFKEGLPLKGMSGKLLRKIISESGLSESDIFYTDVTRCRPIGNKVQQYQINNCQHFLFEEIQIIKPEVIVCVGKVASRLLFQIKEKNFKLADYFKLTYSPIYNTSLIAIFHPAYLCRTGRKNYQECVDIFKKVKEFISE